MRAGPEQFIYRDFAFIDAMIMPVVGFQTIAIYDVLRRYVWRAAEQGSRRARAAFKGGRLSTTISRKKLAAMTGLSIRTIQREINKLRDIGWVKSESGNGTGETVVYELGFRTPTTGEVFYADADARELWIGLEGLAADEGWDRVADLPFDVRETFARTWFESKEGGGDSRDTTPVTAVTPPAEGVVTRVAPRIENPPGGEIEKAEEYPRRSAPEKGSHSPEPKHLDGAGPSGRRRRSRTSKDETTGRLGHINDEEREDIGAEFALDNGEGSGHDDPGERLARASKAIEKGASRADTQVEADAKKRLKKGRTKKVEKVQADEQRAKNLKGGTKFPPQVYRDAAAAYDVYADLIRKIDSSLPVVPWKSQGNGKSRGQMCNLVDMYGGKATEQALRYVVGNWDSINTRLFRRDSQSLPSLGVILSMHETFFREAALWGRHSDVIEEWEAWFEEHPMKRAPRDLKDRYEEAQQALSALGLGS